MSKRVGRPEKIERDIKIWFEFYYLKTPIWELEQKYKISKSDVKRILHKISEKFVNVPNKIILRGSIYSIQERIRNLTSLLEEEMKKKEPSIRNVKELNSELRADQVELDKLQNLYSERYALEIEGGGSIRQILKALMEKKK